MGKECWEKFQQNNKEISLNVLFVPHNKKEIELAYTSKSNYKRKKQVILLMITDDDDNRWHYLSVKVRWHYFLLLRKGIFRYEYIDSWARFDENTIPHPKKLFTVN